MKIDFSKYDKLIWRLNGLLILAVLFATVLGGTLLLGNVAYDWLFKEVHHGVAQVDPTNDEIEIKERLFFGDFEHLRGTNLLSVALNSRQSFLSRGYSGLAKKSYNNYARNHLLIDKLKQQKIWIWPTNAFYISSRDRIYNHLPEDDDQKVIGLLFVVISKDTNNDKNLDGDDRKDLIYYELSGQKMYPILESVESLQQNHQLKNGKIFVFYKSNEKSFYKHFDPFTRISTEPTEIQIPKG